MKKKFLRTALVAATNTAAVLAAVADSDAPCTIEQKKRRPTPPESRQFCPAESASKAHFKEKANTPGNEFFSGNL